ncbi:DUF6491 family protein [Lysobacter humi (ex Lee et al. 2017)]
MRSVLLLLTAALATGCATGAATRRAEQLELYRAHAGAPVRSFSAIGRVDSWTPLTDDSIVVWTSPRRAYLLSVPGCPDLDFAHGIALSESAGQVHAGFDRVTPLGHNTIRVPCIIDEIRPIDVKAYREARRIAELERPRD